MTYTLRSYSLIRAVSEDWSVAIHFAMGIPLRALVYVERKDGLVLDLWEGSYPSVRTMVRMAVERAVYGIGSSRP